jgi:diguanylate cyclase (GGDEF)-like protein
MINVIMPSVFRGCAAAAQGLYRRMIGRDHRVLNGYIMRISQLHDLDSIIEHVACCIRELFNHRHFAFAVYDREFDGGIDIWADPVTSGVDFLGHVQKEFEPGDLNCNVRILDRVWADGEPDARRGIRPMLTVKVLDGPTRARLYLPAARGLSAYQAELIGIIVRTLATAIANYFNVKKLESDSLLDPLTHCYNRRALKGRLEREIAHAQRYGTDLSIVMFDIDHFKRVNDVYGHSAGDAVLGAVAKAVMASIRSSDCLARYGGEEFVLLLPATRFSKAIETAERLRQNLEHMQTTVGGETIKVTSSFGVALHKGALDGDQLIKRADQMLYEAKRLGRNRVQPDLRVYCSPAAGPAAEGPGPAGPELEPPRSPSGGSPVAPLSEEAAPAPRRAMGGR